MTKPLPHRCAADPRIPNPQIIEIDFTDARLTGQGGWALLSRTAAGLDALRRLAEAVCLKRRDCGTSDAKILWSLVASLASGNGALSNVDALRDDAVGCRLLGLRRAPSSRRLSEYLGRFGAAEVAAPAGCGPGRDAGIGGSGGRVQAARRGYVPVFVDGSAIEVDGALFESAGKGYDRAMQYWLHGVFVGPL